MSDESDFAAFQAWKASQAAGQQPTLPADETPTVTLAEVLKALVHSAKFANEAVVRQYCAVIDKAVSNATSVPEESNA
jgi:hypothetical protein